jgi:hypothetical protein
MGEYFVKRPLKRPPVHLKLPGRRVEIPQQLAQADGGVWRAKIPCKFLPKDDRELLSQDSKNNHRVFEQ